MDRGVLVEGLVLIGFSIVGIWEGIGLLRDRYITRDLVGPGGYLIFIFPALFLCTLVYFWRSYPRSLETVRTQSNPIRLGPTARLLMALGVYAAAVSIVGYALGSGIFFVLAFKISGVKSWARSVVLGLIVALAFELVFSRAAKIPFP